MKKLVVLAIIVLGAVIVTKLGGWALSRIWSKEAVASSAARPWPGELGTLESVVERFPPAEGNAAATKLAALAGALPKDDTVEAFVRREIARDTLLIGQPPALPDPSGIRDLLLRDEVSWERREGLGDTETSTLRGSVMTMGRALVASALARGRAGDPGAWDDLRAAWALSRSLDAQPQMMLRTASFSIARMVNAVAWKMPLPAPAWVGEVERRDYLPSLLEGFQHQASSYWGGNERMLPTRWLASSIERDRRIAETLFEERRCDVTAPMNDLGTDLSSVWRRAFRYRAEREATANALRVRGGGAIESASRCSDGGWTLDGTTLRFGRELPTAPPDTPMPLVLRLAP